MSKRSKMKSNTITPEELELFNTIVGGLLRAGLSFGEAIALTARYAVTVEERMEKKNCGDED